jgi:large subunit ribosomal protein L17
MRKMVFGRKLSRGRKGREALFRSLIKAFLVNGKITTTRARAKAIQGEIDKLVSFAKKGSLIATRKASGYLGNDRQLSEVLFGNIARTFKKRASGFTRITLLPRRKGDAAEEVRLEWVEAIVTEEKKPVTKSKVKPRTTKAKKAVKKTEK